MAASITLKDGIASTANANTYASNAFTPDASGLLIVGVVSSGSVAGLTMTDSQSLGWTLVASTTYNTAAEIISIWVANKLAAASSMTVTYGATGSPTGAVVFTWSVTGVTRTGWSAVRQVTDTLLTFAAAGTPGPHFAFAPLTTNGMIGCLGNVNTTATMTPPASWTETATIGEVGYSTPSVFAEAVQRNSGFTSQTVTWGGTSATAGAVLCIELDITAQTAIQSNTNTGSASSTTMTCTYKAAVVKGHVLACYVYWNSATDTCTVGDNVNGANTWTSCAARLAGSGGLAAFSTQAFYFANTAAGTPVVTATFQNARTSYGMVIVEVPGHGLDQAAGSNFNGTVPVTTSLTPKYPNQYTLIGAVFAGNGLRQIGASWTVEEYSGFGVNTVGVGTIAALTAVQGTFGTVATQDVMTFIALFFGNPFPPAVTSTVAVRRAATW